MTRDKHGHKRPGPPPGDDGFGSGMRGCSRAVVVPLALVALVVWILR
jgi:hypothetical protein